MLEVRNLTKSYHRHRALDDVTLSWKPGLYGLLGPNGAGKSTLMNIITGNLRPDGGEVLWNGRDIRRLGKAYRRVLAYAPQQQGLYDAFTGRRFLDYMAALREIPARHAAREIQRAAGAVNLLDELDKRIAAYSGGMKQRLLIAQALLGNPGLLVLDEPTAGLDPKERVRVRSVLREQADSRVVLVATHVVSDVEGVADQILLLRRGRVAASGPPDELIARYAAGRTLEEVYLSFFSEEEPYA